MKYSSTGGLLAFIVVAPIVVICCAGKAALIGALLFGTTGFLTGANLLTITLVATIGGIMLLATRNFMRVRRHNHQIKRNDPNERQTY